MGLPPPSDHLLCDHREHDEALVSSPIAAELYRLADADGCEASRRGAAEIYRLHELLRRANEHMRNLRGKVAKARWQRDEARAALLEAERANG